VENGEVRRSTEGEVVRLVLFMGWNDSSKPWAEALI
jgi:hypothetical protein